MWDSLDTITVYASAPAAPSEPLSAACDIENDWLLARVTVFSKLISYPIEALTDVIDEWSATIALLPLTVIEPGVMFVPVAVTLNSPEPGVPLTLSNWVAPLYAIISVPLPVKSIVPPAWGEVWVKVWDSFVNTTVNASAPAAPSEPGWTEAIVIVSLATSPPLSPSWTDTVNVYGVDEYEDGTVNVAVSEFAPLPSVYELSSEKSEPPPVNLKYPFVKFCDVAVNVIEATSGLEPAALYDIIWVVAVNDTDLAGVPAVPSLPSAPPSNVNIFVESVTPSFVTLIVMGNLPLGVGVLVFHTKLPLITPVPSVSEDGANVGTV